MNSLYEAEFQITVDEVKLNSSKKK